MNAGLRQTAGNLIGYLFDIETTMSRVLEPYKEKPEEEKEQAT